MGKGEIARDEQFLLFPQCFLSILRTFCYFHQIRNCRLQTLSVWKSLKFVVWERVNIIVKSEILVLRKYIALHEYLILSSSADKIVALAKMRAFADDKVNDNQNFKFVSYWAKKTL